MVKDVYDANPLSTFGKDNTDEFLYNKALEGEYLQKEVTQMLFDQFKITALRMRSEWHAADRADGANYGNALSPDDGSDGWASLSELIAWCLEHRDEDGIKGQIRFVNADNGNL